MSMHTCTLVRIGTFCIRSHQTRWIESDVTCITLLQLRTDLLNHFPSFSLNKTSQFQNHPLERSAKLDSQSAFVPSGCCLTVKCVRTAGQPNCGLTTLRLHLRPAWLQHHSQAQFKLMLNPGSPPLQNVLQQFYQTLCLGEKQELMRQRIWKMER